MALGTAGSVVVAAVVAGAVGAGTAVLLREPAGPAGSPAAGNDVAALQGRLEKQEREIAVLRARLDEASSARPFLPPGERGPGPRAPMAGLP